MINTHQNKFKLRIAPWLTDTCTIFLNNFFKWYPSTVNKRLTALEFGGGNSTIFFLQKGVQVVTAEGSIEFANLLIDLASRLGYRAIMSNPHDYFQVLGQEFDLLVILTDSVECVPKLIRSHEWTFLINDGISRDLVLREVIDFKVNSIVILDNTEYCANWGRLDRTSAKPKFISAYRSFLRGEGWNRYIFEQPEGRDGRGVADSVGWESPHRWASAVAWLDTHILTKHIVTNLGFPLVNSLGIDDQDVATVEERCPYDWEKLCWVKEAFPPELNLELYRSYE